MLISRFLKTFDTVKNFMRMKTRHNNGEMNLSLVLHRTNEIELEVRPIPIPRENEILIRVGCVCLSDIDLNYIQPGPTTSYGFATSYVLGSQASGIVVEAGVGVEENFKEGDKVVLEPGVYCGTCEFCREERYNLCPKFTLLGTANRSGALCRYVAHPMRNCHKLPQNIELHDGAMCTKIASAIHACKRAKLNEHSIVAIIGSGLSGLSLVLTCRILGIKNLIVVESNEYRLDMARRFGADYTVKFRPQDDPNYLKEILGEFIGGSPEVTFETAGTDSSMNLASVITKSGGQIVIVGSRPHLLTTSFHHVTYREIDIKGVYNTGDCFQDAIQYVKGGLIKVKDLSPLIVPLEQAVEALNHTRINIGTNAVTIVECYNESTYR